VTITCGKLMEMKTPDKVASSYSKNPPKLKVTTFSGSDEGSHVLLEGNHRALRMLGEMLIATADQKTGFDFHMHPRGAGVAFFNDASTHGICLSLVDSPKAR
jgi:hypothetical protein